MNNYNNYKTITYKLNTNNNNSTANINEDHSNILLKLFLYIMFRYFI